MDQKISGRLRSGPGPVPLRFPPEVFGDQNGDLSTSFAMTCAGYKEIFQNQINRTTISRDRDFFWIFENFEIKKNEFFDFFDKFPFEIAKKT